MQFAELRHKVYETSLKLVDADLIRISAGNVSLRDDEGMIAITPSSIPYDRMTPEDIFIVDGDGQVLDGRSGGKPSSELALHTILLAGLPSMRAVIHTHSVYAMALAAVGAEIPVVCLEALTVGGPIPVAPYACPGTPAVGQVALDVFRSRPGLKGLLLQNHGLIAVGADLDKAFENAYNTETAAQVYHLALQIGTPQALTREQIEEILKLYPAKR